MPTLHQLARSRENLESLRELLESGEDPNSRDLGDNTPLHIASLKAVTADELEINLRIARELIRFGAEVNEQNTDGYSPLHFAVACQKPEMVRCLLEANAEINIRNDLQQTPLMLAANFQNFQIVKDLLDQHASVNLQDREGNSAMHYALCHSRVDQRLVAELLRHECDLKALNRDQKTPLDHYLLYLPVAEKLELENARWLFKLFIFQSSHFTPEQSDLLNRISWRREVNLSLICHEFCKEIEDMKRDILSSNYTMYDIASRGFYYKKPESHNHISFNVYDSVLDRLIKGKYPLYLDFILSGICTPYFRFKFSKVCRNRENYKGFLNYDILYLLSLHLSHLEMLRMIIVFSSN